jgi:hypothetical protein
MDSLSMSFFRAASAGAFAAVPFHVKGNHTMNFLEGFVVGYAIAAALFILIDHYRNR